MRRRGSQGHNREKATQCSWFGIGRSGGGGMRSGAALMSACVWGQWGPPASLLWSRVRGATGGASPPSPSTARRPRRCRWPLSSSAHPPLASHARLAHAARLGRCPNDRRAGARCFKVCLCLFAATPNPRASVRVRRASPHAGEARAAPQPSHSPLPREGGSARCGATRVRVLKTDLRNQG